MARKIRLREKEAIIQSLKAGVTPKIGIQHIQVGRFEEIKALDKDIEKISDCGASFRLIIGDYGSGKTFLMSVVRSIALKKRLVTVNADLSPVRRIYSTTGQARNLYAELMRNLSTLSKPDGNALPSVVERFITLTRNEADQNQEKVSHLIHKKLAALQEMVGGYDFADAVNAYWRGYETGNEELKSNSIRWLRAEYATKTEARRDLGVRTIISDGVFYDALKLMSLFVRQAGYKGLLINLDEMVNLYKLRHTQARTSNYEQLLRILNDCLQGSAQNIGFLLGGTPEFLLDSRKGLFSYEALKSRLEENTFAQMAGVIDYSSPTLHLANLTPEEMFILLKNLRHVFSGGDASKYLVQDDVLKAFLDHCGRKIGDAYFRTPRNTVKAFLDFLAVLEQYPDRRWSDLIDEIAVEQELPSDADEIAVNHENGNSEYADLASFRI